MDKILGTLRGQVKVLKAQVEALSAVIESEIGGSGGSGGSLSGGSRERQRAPTPSAVYSEDGLAEKIRDLLDQCDWLEEEVMESETPLFVGAEERDGVTVYPVLQGWIQALAAGLRSQAESADPNGKAACNAGIQALARISATHKPGYCFGLALGHRPRPGSSWADEERSKLAALRRIEAELSISESSYIVER